MPTYGLRLRTYSQSLGSTFDWFVDDVDMPDALNRRGTEVFRDIHTTPSGNTYLYDKGKRKRWEMSFQDITTRGITNLQHCVSGWLGSRQITMVYFGTSVIGTNESAGSMSSAGQLWGTCWLEMPKIAEEVAFDMWNADIVITEFGNDQIFTQGEVMKGYEGLIIRGDLKVYKIRDGHKELVHQHKNTIGSQMYINLANVLISRSVEYGYDAIAWGSFKVAGGTFIDGTFAGTTSSGTGGSLIQSIYGSLAAKLSGTFSFTTTKLINFFELGRGYTAPAAGVTALFTSIYNYDNSLLTGSTSLQYDNGDTMIVDWITTIGS